MGKQLLCVSILLFTAQIFAQDYTVILKNGKVIKGTLISETESTIVLRDEQGIHFSLKKAMMDLDRMKEANEAPPPPPPPPQPSAEAPVKKTEAKNPARVYRASDVQALRDKYGDLSPGQIIIEDEEGVLSPESYYRALQDGAARTEMLLGYVRELSTGMATTWEIAASTGKSPQAALNEYMTAGAGLALSGVVENQLEATEPVRTRLLKAPEEYEQVPEVVTQVFQNLRDAYTIMQRYGAIRGFAQFQAGLQNLIGTAEAGINTLRATKEVVQAPPPVPAAATTPPQQEETQEGEAVEEPFDVTGHEPPQLDEQ